MTSSAWSDFGVNRLIKRWSNSLRCELTSYHLALKIKMGCGGLGIPGNPGRGGLNRINVEAVPSLGEFPEEIPG